MKKDADIVYRYTKSKIKNLCRGDKKDVLARLRHGAGKEPGADPRLWDVIFNGMPQELAGYGTVPSKAERAIYGALTQFALHQQGKDPSKDCVSCDNVSLGKAAAALIKNDSDRARVTARFNTVVSGNADSVFTKIRGFIQLLKSKNAKLDYAMLAKDLYLYQFDNERVKLKWGRDMYTAMNKKKEADNAEA